MMTKRLLDQVVKGRIEAGCDEAGRGCLAGPVVAAAVRFDKRHNIKGLADSKTLSPQKRIKLYFEIIETFSVGVSFSSAKSIDSFNILGSSLHVMQVAVQKVSRANDGLYFDGNTLPKRFRSAARAYSIIKETTK